MPKVLSNLEGPVDGDASVQRSCLTLSDLHTINLEAAVSLSS